jgi:hypothetical protein
LFPSLLHHLPLPPSPHPCTRTITITTTIITITAAALAIEVRPAGIHETLFAPPGNVAKKHLFLLKISSHHESY